MKSEMGVLALEFVVTMNSRFLITSFRFLIARSALYQLSIGVATSSKTDHATHSHAFG